MILTKTIRLRLLLLWGSLSVLLFSTNTYAQTRRISGTVVEQRTSDPVPGAVVTVKDTKRAVITDASGMFTIEATTGEVLEVTMLGFQKAEVVVGTGNSVNVKLTESVSQLAEVVVNIGYGTAKKSDLTGSISSITGDELRKTQPVTFEQALQGKVPGVVVQQISGQPGGGVSVQIRGITSINSGTAPLYVIDGVIIGGSGLTGSGANPLAAISPSEIQSIDVLKDASATAIYGSQATNGVIVITTKRGKAGAPRIAYDVYSGYQQILKRLPLMNLREFAGFVNERNSGLGWGFDTRPEFANAQYLGEGTDWQKELFRNAPMSNHSLTVSGGDERTKYLLSGAYFKQDGIALGSDFRRVSVRLNLDNKTTNWLKIGTNLQLANIKENVNSTSSNVISTALSQTPDIAVKNPDGSWGGSQNPNGWVASVINPYAIALIIKNQAKRDQMYGNVYAEVSFTKDLMLKNEVTGSFGKGTEDRFTPTYTMGRVVNAVNNGSYKYGQNFYTTLRNYLTYSHVFKTKYNVNLMAGHEGQLNTSEEVSASRSNFPSNNVQAVNSGDPTTALNMGDKSQSAQESFFGRLNFGINDKYLLTGNFRADGSSKFAAGNRWVNTYSGAFAWKINKEKFLSNVKELNELKLRLGYGLTNNQGISNYAYTSALGTVATGLSGVSQLTNTFGNSDVLWEKTKYSNIGLDGALLAWRINFSVDFYNRRTDGLLMKAVLPLYSGTTSGWSPGSIGAPFVNVGIMNNKGLDFRISTTNISEKNITWKTDFTASRNINKVVTLNTVGASLPGWFTNRIAARTAEGRSIGEFYGYMVEGVYATKDQLENHARVAKNGVAVPVGAASGSIWYGDLMFKDLNGDGIIDESDQTYLGSPLPKWQLGFNNSFNYKNFDLNVFFSANLGNKVLNGLRINGENTRTSYGYLKGLSNYAKLGLLDPNGSNTDVDNVYVLNPDTRIAGIRNDNTNENDRISDKYIEDGSFLRCKSIALGYNFSDKLLTKIHVPSLRVYVNVSNAFIITKYKGMDPEIGSWDPLQAGMDNGFYPQPRVFTLGANIALTK